MVCCLFSCGFPKNKSLNLNIELGDMKQEIPVNLESRNDEFVYKRSICLKGYASERIILNSYFELKGQIDTCFQGDWYQSTDTLRFEYSPSVKGDLAIEYKIFFQ